MQIKDLQVSLFLAKVVAVGIEFKGDPVANPQIHFSAEEIVAQFKLVSFLQGVPTLELLDLSGLHVTLIEPDTKSHSTGPDYPPPGEGVKSFPIARMDEILIHHSQFTYRHSVHGRVSKIDVREIDGKIGAFVTRDWLLEKGYRQPLKMAATALLEKSGRVSLQVSFDPFAQKNHDEILIKVKGQSLSDLNSFFKIEEGIHLSGVLEEGVASMKLSEGHLSGSLTAVYKDIQVKFEKTPDRGAIKSFLTTLAQSIASSKTRPKKGEKSLPRAPIKAERHPHEPITKLLIRGLLNSAKEIMTH